MKNLFYLTIFVLFFGFIAVYYICKWTWKILNPIPAYKDMKKTYREYYGKG